MVSFLLLEDGSNLLLEDGSNLLLETISAVSKSIDFNNGTITRAKLTATYTGNVPTLFLTANGTDYEEVTSGTTHTFTNTGTDLRWKAEGTGITITKIKIEDYH